jgi:hypothetical protein
LENHSFNIPQLGKNNSLYDEFILFFLITLIINPIYVIIILGLYNLNRKIELKILFIWAISYSTLLINRKYFIRFSESSNDDTITYIPHIISLKNINFFDAFKLENMTGIEPFSQFFWWVSQFFNIPINLVLFTQVCLWVIGIVILSNSISKRYSATLVLFSIGLFPALIPYAFFHQYRQSWAMFFVCISLAHYRISLINRLKILYLTSHLSTLIIWFFDLLINFLKKISLLKILFILFLIFILYSLIINSLIFRFNKYFFESQNQIENNGMAIKSIIGIISISIFYKYCEQTIRHKIIYFTSIIVLLISFFPIFESFSNRLISLIIPIMLIVIAPIRNMKLITILALFSTFQLINYLLIKDNLYSFTIGSLSPKLILPFYDFFHFIFFGNDLFENYLN